MGLFKRGEIWWMSFTYQGKQIRRSTETPDRKLAQRIFDKIKGEIAEGKWFERLPGEDYFFKDLVDKYLEEYSARNKAPKTYIRDKSLCNHLLNRFGNVPVLEIGSNEISAFKNARREKGASPRTVNYELTLLSHMFNIAIREWEWLKENPVKRVSRERVYNQIERWLTTDEEKGLLKASPRWLKEIIVFAINTGFRQSEILELKWGQIDFNRRTITISEQKNRSVDTLPVNQTVMNLLKLKWNKELSAQDLVFPSLNNTRILNRNVFRAFHAALDKAEIKKFRFHDLRHTFATRLIQNGVDQYTVQKLGRWKHPAMVMRYAHHYPESLRAGIEVMDKVQSGVITILAQSQKERGHKPLLRLVTP